MDILADLPEIINKYSHHWIYGAHTIAQEFLAYLHLHNLDDRIQGFLVTSKAGNPAKIRSLPVFEFQCNDAYENDVLIWIAAPEKFHPQIIKHLTEHGCTDYIELGNKGLAKLENDDVLQFLSKRFPSLDAMQSSHEYLCLRLNIRDRVYNLMVLGCFPFSQKSIDCLRCISSHPDAILPKLREAGLPLYKKTNPSSPLNIDYESLLQVYVISSADNVKENIVPYHPWEIPLIAGAALSDCRKQEGIRSDDEGENISRKNALYAELTGTYWAWKNSDARYKGICHYRRRYLIDDDDLSAMAEGSIDVIVTTPRLVLPSLAEWFVKVSTLGMSEIKSLIWAVNQCFHEECDQFEEFLHGNILYPNNMIIARHDLYDVYCKWLFKILETIEGDDSYTDIRECPRGIAYCAELLTSFYFMSYCAGAKKCSVIFYTLL